MIFFRKEHQKEHKIPKRSIKEYHVFKEWHENIRVRRYTHKIDMSQYRKKQLGIWGGAASPPAGFEAEPQEIFEFRPSKTPKSFNLGLV